MSDAATLPVPPVQEPLQVPPLPEQRGTIIAEDLRHWLYDRTINDSPLDVDLTWSDQEIATATRYAVMMANSVQPYSITYSTNALTGDYFWLPAIAYHLFLGKLMVLTRSDISYDAGGMSADITRKRIEHYKWWIQLFKAEATDLIEQQKMAVSINGYFACY